MVEIVRCGTEKLVTTIGELEPWSPELDDEFCESSSDDEFVGDEKNNSITGDANMIMFQESSFMNDEYPKTPNIGGSQNVSGVNRSFSLKTGGSIMDVIENLVEVGQTMGYNMAGCKKNLEDIVASHGDSMLSSEQGWNDLECDVTFRCDHRKPVWDCGTINRPRSLGTFEKGFDSVDWEFLEYYFKKLWVWHSNGEDGFRMSFVGLWDLFLVNGSTTAEFKFHKGLKKEDPSISLFFILVMSFIGKWDRAIISYIVRMLKMLFFGIRGLQITILKSKLMGSGVVSNERKFLRQLTLLGVLLFPLRSLILVSRLGCLLLGERLRGEINWFGFQFHPLGNCILKELILCRKRYYPSCAFEKESGKTGSETLSLGSLWDNDVPHSRSFTCLFALELKKKKPRGGVEALIQRQLPTI
ncbi:hypothetical protein Tco_0808313 [Tanacetum coccineum]